ncbi:hypothetical protein F5Y10DRAFT_84954 [Nemania abortiva]|nr:hypothetical protein F5Y10DRAFT_84954 [Nemania abortiva]
MASTKTSAPCANPPTIDPSERLLQAIQDFRDNMNKRFDSLEIRLNSMDIRMSAMQANGITRMLNNNVTQRDAPLIPLNAVATNTPIDHFPQTITAIDRLTTQAINDIFVQLGELGEPVNGDLPEKKKRLKTLAGVISESVL